MKRIISAKYCKDYVKVAYFEDLELKHYDEIKISRDDKFKCIEDAISIFANKHNIKIYKLALNMDDNECISQYINIDSKDEKNFGKNIRYQFPDFISEEEMDDYVYDFQCVKRNNNTSEMCAVAAPKNKIEDYLMVAINLNKKLDILRPESASIGCLLSAFDIGGIIVADIGMDETIIKIFENKKLLATSIMQHTANFHNEPTTNDIPYDYKRDDSKKEIGKIVANIVKTVAFYDEKKISKRDYKILIIGSRPYITQIKRALGMHCVHNVISPKEFIKGRLSEEEASSVFSMYGIIF